MNSIPLHKINKGIMVFLALSLTITLISCGSGKRASLPSNIEQLTHLVSSGNFEIIHDWAQPQQGNQINLIGNSNFIRFKGDSVNLFLPYFGVRHSGGGYGNQGGILYKGQAENMEIKKVDTRFLLRFEGEHESEHLRFIITLFPNGNTTTSVTSSQRQVITYRGKLRASKTGEA